MSATDKQAADEINGVVLTAWTAGAVTAIEGDIVGGLFWQGKPEKEKPGNFWARVTQQIVTQPQKSIVDENTFGASKKRYETFGFVTVQVFAPEASKNAFRKGDALASLLRDAFRRSGQGGEVWFKNSRKMHQGNTKGELQWNVVAEFSYDTIV